MNVIGRLGIICVMAVLGGCTANAAESKTVLLQDMAEQSLSDTGVWQSSGWGGDGAAPWIAYNGRVHLRLQHGLGRAPQGILVYLSFSEDGSSAALAAGDMAHVVSVDDQYVEISNQTNSDFYARFVVF